MGSTSEYLKIIALSLSEGNPIFAFNVARAIYGRNLRNQEFSKIISKCLSLGRYEIAIKVADEVYGRSQRDKEYKKIISTVMAKRKGSSFAPEDAAANQ